MKKKFNLLIVLFLTVLILPFRTYAARGSYSISSNSSVEVGNTISVTFTISAKNLYYWQAYITYDTNKLELISGSTTFQGDKDAASNKRTLKFKAKKTGSAWVAIAMGDADNNINYNSENISYKKASKTISIKEKVVKTYSSNNNLKALSISDAELDPEFSKNKTEYSTTLPAGTTKININADTEDKKAKIDGDGEIEVNEGTNKITIKVTAENGNTKEYIINATVKEYDPIEVKVNNESYTVIRKKDDLPKPSSTYEETTIKIKDNEIPAFKSDITKYTLVGLKDEKGSIKLYVYDEATEKYTLYNEISFNKLTIYPTNEEFSVSSNFVKETKNIGDIPVLLYTDSKNKDFSIFMGINIETGEKNIYEYDSKENTIQRYKKDDIKAKTNDNIYLYASFGLGALLVVTYLVIIISLIKKKPKKIKLNYDKNN